MCCCAVLMFNDRLDVIPITEAEGNSETTAAGVMLFNSGYTTTIIDYRSMRNKTSQQCYVFSNRYPQISDSGQDNMTVLSSTQIHSAVLPFTSTANHSLCYFSIDFEEETLEVVTYGEQHDIYTAQQILLSWMETADERDGEERFELY